MTASCDRAKSDTTPCVVRDGAVCFAMDWRDEPICVGCERSPKNCGVERPADWSETVETYYRENPSAKRHVPPAGRS